MYVASEEGKYVQSTVDGECGAIDLVPYMYLMMDIISSGGSSGQYNNVSGVLLKLVGLTSKYTFGLSPRIVCVSITLK